MPSPTQLTSPLIIPIASPPSISAITPLSGRSIFDELKKTSNETDPWEICNLYAKKHTSELCDSWRDEVDKLLIFAGLFSGVVTSFAIESYDSVKEDPAETTALLLKTIILQLDNMTNPQPSTVINLNPVPDAAPQFAKRINTFWFLSLALSLSTVMAGILCLQWLREYGRDANVPHREDVALHHMRYQGMKKWHVFKILNALPIVLIAALVLFFAGFIEVLWKVDRVAAALVAIVVGIALGFILLTTMLPTLQCLYICAFPDAQFVQCPYKSPQAWMVQKSIGLLSYLVDRWKSTKSSSSSSSSKGESPVRFRDLFEVQSWPEYDRFLRRRRDASNKHHTLDVGRGLAWIGETFVQHQKVVHAVCRCLRDLDPRVALEGSLAQLDRRRAASVRRVKGQRPASWDNTQPRRSKTVFDQDLIVSHALEHFAEKIEQGHMSPTLLQQRLDLFLKINEGDSADGDVECPVNHNNVTLINRDFRLRILSCIQSMLNRNTECDATHMNGAFEIIRTIFMENQRTDEVPSTVSEMLDELLLWISKESPNSPSSEKSKEKTPYDRERRLTHSVLFHKLIFVCKGENDRNVVDQYRQGLEDKIKAMFGKEMIKEGIVAGLRFPYLTKYMDWRQIQ